MHAMFTLEFPRPAYGDTAAWQGAPDKVSEKTSEKILHLIEMNPHITIAELAAVIGVTTLAIERHWVDSEQFIGYCE